MLTHFNSYEYFGTLASEAAAELTLSTTDSLHIAH